MRGLVSVGLVLALAVIASASSLEDRVREVASRLMCPVCAGRTVAESTSELAAQMRALIRERLQRGESPEAIVAYFVERYGEGILAEPPRRGLGALVWLAPALAILGGLAYVVARFGRTGAGLRPEEDWPDSDEDAFS
ncbi:MAG: cytochrome c-type biogenesis protein CcmH [Armatimonadota bacterium]|nr:cytochrome c-type biogenesis protein CcmH [Armatimonadota bacterium]MDR7439969.1 cytochrome c-type biogenesis protein CcmH [Armatimonadota bacterium]MDR7562365.1 cytochrome c-type biogenesis protein CcmH [Armatimonadota bacterium]MDR7567236.1 cytochrome c-type biogenesis protein CcmH [Armatimonadota bacterium]MDR7601552.1 cytochrome c-type biogenesis protein CcmH [Armatimonadota bacterium]